MAHHLLHAIYPRLSMNLLAFVFCCVDLILDENLCDYHWKFMLCREAIGRYSFLTFNGVIPDRGAVERIKIRNANSIESVSSSQRNKSVSSIKDKACCTHKRFGTKSFVASLRSFLRSFRLCFTSSGSRFRLSRFAIFYDSFSTMRNGRFSVAVCPFSPILLFIYDLALYERP